MMELKTEDFKAKVLDSKKPVLVDFWGSWCIPCKQMEPLIKQLKEEVDIDIYKVNVNQNPTISAKEKVMGVPTFILYQSGKQIDRLVGAQTLETLKNFIDSKTK